jgi:hypothetical protein
MWGISWVTEDVLASQEGLCSMESVSLLVIPRSHILPGVVSLQWHTTHWLINKALHNLVNAFVTVVMWASAIRSTVIRYRRFEKNIVFIFRRLWLHPDHISVNWENNISTLDMVVEVPPKRRYLCTRLHVVKSSEHYLKNQMLHVTVLPSLRHKDIFCLRPSWFPPSWQYKDRNSNSGGSTTIKDGIFVILANTGR